MDKLVGSEVVPFSMSWRRFAGRGAESRRESDSTSCTRLQWRAFKGARREFRDSCEHIRDHADTTERGQYNDCPMHFVLLEKRTLLRHFCAHAVANQIRSRNLEIIENSWGLGCADFSALGLAVLGLRVSLLLQLMPFRGFLNRSASHRSHLGVRRLDQISLR